MATTERNGDTLGAQFVKLAESIIPSKRIPDEVMALIQSYPKPEYVGYLILNKSLALKISVNFKSVIETQDLHQVKSFTSCNLGVAKAQCCIACKKYKL